MSEPSSSSLTERKTSEQLSSLADDAPQDDDPPVRVVPLEGDAPFNADERLFAEQMERFYTRNVLRDQVAPYVNGDRALSKRDMTWAGTHYFKHYPVFVRHPHAGFAIRLDEAYAIYLDEYKRHRFDSFRRTYSQYSRRVRVVCPSDASFALETTFAQLKFFSFAIPFKFLEHCERHVDAIKKHWADAQGKRTNKRAAEQAISGSKAKRAALTEAPSRHMEMVRGHFEIHY